jgi:hypothetical protein
MVELAEQIRNAYAAAQAEELLARQHPEHLEHAQKAAEHFECAALLSQRQAEDDEYVEEVRHVALVLAEYYFAQMHKNRGWHAYECRDCAVALAELVREREHFERAVRDAEGLMSALSDKGKAFLGPQIQSWKVSLAGLHPAELTYRARLAWDAGDAVEALDWYRHSVREAGRLLELEKDVPPQVNPAAFRVIRGNLYSTIANASQASAKILLDQARIENRSLYDFSRDEGLHFLGHFLDSHRAGTAAMTENPEWQQIGMATKASRENIEQFLKHTKLNWGLIYTRFQGDMTLESLMKHLDPERYAMARDDKILRENKGARLWAMGSFWVFAFVCVASAIILLATVVSPWVVLPAIIGIEVILLFIGALTLRTTEDLSQSNFLKLVGLAARFQFRSLLQFMKSTPRVDQDAKPPAVE